MSSRKKFINLVAVLLVSWNAMAKQEHMPFGFVPPTDEYDWIQLTSDEWIKGELLRLKNQDSTAEECFRTSLEVAASQSALSLELRTATSLAGLLAESDRTNEARQLLENTLCRFTEGFESADLQDANSLLITL